MTDHNFNDSSITLPSISEQQSVVFELATKEAIQTLQDNLNAPVSDVPVGFDESLYSNSHLLLKDHGWEAPDKEIVFHYLKQLKEYDSKFTGNYIAKLLKVSPRRLRDWKAGTHKFPYDRWRQFLVLTGRVPQHVEKVLVRFNQE